MPKPYAWLQMLVDTSFASRFLIDSDWKIVFANRAAELLFGYPSNELTGKPIDVLFFSNADRAKIEPGPNRPGRFMVGDDQEIKGRTKDGSELILRIGVSPIRTDRASYFTVTAFDITEYKKLEGELRFRAKQLEEVNSRLSRFAYFASHDLQEPLRKVASFSTLMKAALSRGDIEAAKHASDVAHDSAIRARGFVDQLLNYCSDMSDILQLEIIDLHDEVEEALRDMSAILRQADAKLEEKIPSDLKVMADKSQFDRLVHNLVSNSIKFRKSGRPLEITVSANQINGLIQLAINDNGVGFEPKYAESIFEPFQRLHSCSEIPNSGISLAAVKSICERHGWNVKADSLPGSGATFYVNMPAMGPNPNEESKRDNSD